MRALRIGTLLSCHSDWQVTRVSIRTWWVDKCVKDALSGAFSGGDGAGPRQVVLLGAGMDTRPWRDLEYPPGGDVSR